MYTLYMPPCITLGTPSLVSASALVNGAVTYREAGGGLGSNLRIIREIETSARLRVLKVLTLMCGCAQSCSVSQGETGRKIG